MNNQPKSSFDPKPFLAMGIIVLVGLVGMSAYLNQGENILWSLVQTGLAWCF